MKLKILQLNIFQGKFLDTIIEFVKKEDIDILQLQEVSGGRVSRGGMYKYPLDFNPDEGKGTKKFAGIDCFEYLKNNLSYNGILAKAHTFINDPSSYLGNATLFKPSLAVTDHKTVWVNEFREIPEDFRDIPNLPRNALVCNFDIHNKPLTFINAHLTWGPHPHDEPYKIHQAQILYNYITSLKHPFIFTGDFNVTPETTTASMFDSLGNNHVKLQAIKNTINFRVHPAAREIYPPGLAVDYIFTHPSIDTYMVQCIDTIDLSDHFPLLLECEY